MGDSVTFHVSVVTPERAVLEREAAFVALPAWDGEIGVLRDRAPLVCKLAPGVLRVRGGADGEERLFIDGGFAEVVDNRLTVLTESALRLEEIDRAGARRSLEEALALPARDDAAQAAKARAVAAARARLRAVR